MEMVYAALLLHSLKKPVDEKGIKKIVEAAGGEADAAQRNVAAEAAQKQPADR